MEDRKLGTPAYIAGGLVLAALVAILAKRLYVTARATSDLQSHAPTREEVMANGVRTFCVVARAPSGVYWPPGQNFTINNLGTASGPVSIVFATHRSQEAGFSKPVARGLHVEVRGRSSDIDAAITNFGGAAYLMLPILVMAVNAPVGALEIELALETTAGRSERDYFQQFVPRPRFSPVKPRKVKNEIFLAMLGALEKHHERDRIHRATAYYAHALEQWRPGTELSALAHVYMGMEAMTPVELRAELEARGYSRDELCVAWGIDLKRLDPTVRERLIFQGDSATYKKAKDASDGYEHAYRPFPELHSDAKDVLLKAASYLRQTIVKRLQLGPVMEAEALAPPYDTPFHLHFAKYLRGKLLEVGEDPAAEGELYPFMVWSSKVSEIKTPEDQDPGIRFTDTITVRVAAGVKFQGTSVEVWGPAKSSQESKPAFPTAGA
jgi:hypothetical protein